MDRITKLAVGGAVAAAMLSMGTAQAEEVDQVFCRSGTASVVAKDEKLLVFVLDHLGVAQTADPKDLFHNATQRCVGVAAIFDGKVEANGWCRTVLAKTGDWVLVEWKNDEKRGSGTWTFRQGTGVLKGVTGSGTYRSLGQTRPMEAGTYQNCVRIKGTRKISG